MDFQFLNHQSLERSSTMDECEDENLPPLITNDTPDSVKDLGFTVNACNLSNLSSELGLKADAEQSQKNQRWRNAYQTKSGRWRTEITHPVTKARIRFRSFDTAEEAKEAYDSKRREFDSMFPGHNKSEKSKNRCELELKKHQRLRYVYPRKSGRWQTEIRHPITKARIHLGTFDTAEEAKEVYDSKMREFDLEFLGNKKLKQGNDDPSISSGESSVIKASSNVNAESVPMFDLDVIDSYGQLVGEYSRLDDELWL